MKNTKNVLAILLQLSTAIVTRILNYSLLAFVLLDGYNYSMFFLLMLTIIVEAIIYSTNIAVFKICKKQFLILSKILFIATLVLNVPLTLSLLGIYILALLPS
jgi:hypothetical protein